MDPTVYIMTGIIVAMVSAMIGHIIGKNGKVSIEHCSERRQACNSLILEKLLNLENMLREHIERENKK